LSRESVEEDLGAAGLLLRTYSAGPVSPFATIYKAESWQRAATLDDSINPNSGFVRNMSVALFIVFASLSSGKTSGQNLEV
jgi:hypothetical protein